FQLLKSYSPHVQPLVTGIVVRINWLKVVQDFDQSENSRNSQKAAKFYALLLDIVTRCGSRKENLTDCKASYFQMMTALQSLSWNVVDFARLNDSLQYFVDTFGADTVFSFEDDSSRLVLRLLEKATEFSPLAPCQSLQGRLSRLERRRLFVEMLMRCLISYCQIKDSSVDFAARYFVDAVDRLELLIAMI
uniref:Uncharacterized protein n=1 Tax=Romanomermis culicivorax TaxID=13658 RepID=A0A915JM22_ROMCU